MLDSSSHAIDMQLLAREGSNLGGGVSNLAVATAKLPDESFWQFKLPKSAEFPLEEFLRIGFTQHIAVLTKAKSLPKRLFYIRRSAEQDYSVEELEAAIARDDYRHQGSMPNNFTKIIPATSRSLRAIRGKLVPQDPNDEPASVLLERIKAEKAKLVKAGKIKKEKSPSEIVIGSDGAAYRLLVPFRNDIVAVMPSLSIAIVPQM